ncbi:MAG: 1-deoxy-D-xylulose-5-phosphate reductoisomerase [Gammaproteobacteria bacterium]|nr:MAG: 1-deoxy-D-xylulose-5-phosphate reductoisomerase [Gammaproteobacteria bacterium]
MTQARQKITIFGSTGSIGKSTLDVIALHPDRFEVFALTARGNMEKLRQQCRQFNSPYAVLEDPQAAERLENELRKDGVSTEILCGQEGLIEMASRPEVDTVMAAIVGAAGLPSAFAAAQSGKKVLLANKEALVISGNLFMEAVAESGATLLPIDSEHNAIFQCLPEQNKRVDSQVRRILLTASGGPFRNLSLQELSAVTPEQACAHPNWSMGRKISVDSATMMNKGLELIEACWLFRVAPRDIQVVIHPQSIIHSMVEYIDGSVIAQMGSPDMKIPIANALGWPQRIVSGSAFLDLFEISRLDFAPPSEARFPCLRLAREAMEAGGACTIALNAANEVAVAAFLDGKCRFDQIPIIIEKTLESSETMPVQSLQHVLEMDAAARLRSGEILEQLN